MKTQLRIVAGSLKGRKLVCQVDPDMRPMPDMARQALFSILGEGVPGQTFVDIFAGTGSVGMEAVSRGASNVIFVERDVELAGSILKHAKAFGVHDRLLVQRADAYRWIERWQPPPQAVNVFLGPPFPDYEHRLPDLLLAFGDLQRKVPASSVIVTQSDRDLDVGQFPDPAAWDHRLYGRNRLSFWVQLARDGA